MTNTTKFIRLMSVVCAMLLCISCDNNAPSASEGNEKIKGVWCVQSGTRTYYTETGVEVEKLEKSSQLPLPNEWYFGEFLGKEMVEYYPHSALNDYRWRDYTLTASDNGYTLVIDGIFDTEGYNPDQSLSNNKGSNIRISKLSDYSMEWEFKYGSLDEKADTYHLTLKKTAKTPY